MEEFDKEIENLKKEIQKVKEGGPSLYKDSSIYRSNLKIAQIRKDKLYRDNGKVPPLTEGAKSEIEERKDNLQYVYPKPSEEHIKTLNQFVEKFPDMFNAQDYPGGIYNDLASIIAGSKPGQKINIGKRSGTSLSRLSDAERMEMSNNLNSVMKEMKQQASKSSQKN